MNKRGTWSASVIAMVLGIFPVWNAGVAFGACVFTFIGSTMALQGDCTTDTTITVPDGFTLDGQHYTITAINPTSSHFVGGVIENGGAVAHVKHVIIETQGLTNVCDAGENRLQGILFDGAQGASSTTPFLTFTKEPAAARKATASKCATPLSMGHIPVRRLWRSPTTWWMPIKSPGSSVMAMSIARSTTTWWGNRPPKRT